MVKKNIRLAKQTEPRPGPLNRDRAPSGRTVGLLNCCTPTTYTHPHVQNQTHRITPTEPHTAPLLKSRWCVLVCLQQSMAETFYLSNIVPQNYENNAGFWNRCVSCFRTSLRSGTSRYPTLEHCRVPLRTNLLLLYVCRLDVLPGSISMGKARWPCPKNRLMGKGR